MTERDSRRVSTENDLSRSQTARTESRRRFINLLLDCFADVAAHGVGALPQWRERLTGANVEYTDVLNSADSALLSRVTAILLNEQIDRAIAIDALKALIEQHGAQIERLESAAGLSLKDEAG